MARTDDFDDLLNNADELLKYLGHLNKGEHISTVTELIRRVSANEGVIDKQRDKLAGMNRERDMMLSNGMDRIQRHPRVIELPEGARKISIEL